MKTRSRGSRSVIAMDDGVRMAMIPYICRICENEQDVGVNPKYSEEEGCEVVEIDGKHKLADVRCPECEQSRIHVAKWFLEG